MKYIKEDIEKILIGHKEDEGKKIEIELQIESYQERLNYAGTVYQDTDVEIIEAMQLAGQDYNSVHSNTNKTTDKTASTAINYEKEKYHINREDIDYLQNKIQELEAEKDKVNKKVVRVKNWLDKITDEQNKVISLFYIENKGKKWDKVVKEYNFEYDKEMTERGLRKIRDKAIESILKMVNV